MIWPFIVVIMIALLAYFTISNRMENRKYVRSSSVSTDEHNEDDFSEEELKLPYRVSNSVLTDAEKSFYHTLKLFVGDRAVICPKIGLKDLFFISREAGKDYLKYFGKIAQKHIDFVLCNPVTMLPLCAIELDDISHTRKKSFERYQFVEKIFKDAGLD